MSRLQESMNFILKIILDLPVNQIFIPLLNSFIIKKTLLIYYIILTLQKS